MKKLFLLTSILFFSISSAQNEGYRLKTNLYESILEYSLKASDINAIANGIEKVGFTVVSSNVISDDGTYITTQFLIGDDEHILISKSRNFGDTQKIIFLHQTNIFNFIIHYLNTNASIYKPNQIWYNRNKNVAFIYTTKDNIVAILEIVKL